MSSIRSFATLAALAALATASAACSKGKGGDAASTTTTTAAAAVTIAASCDAIKDISTCMDYLSASTAKEDCPSFGGKVNMTPCTTEKLSGSCTIEGKGIRRYYASGAMPSTPDYAHGHCENSMGGTFIAAPAVAATGPGTTAPAANAGGSVIPEMAQFMGELDGTSKKVGAALKKHGAKGLKTEDMGMWNLASPQITATTTNGKQTCYTIDAASGATTRTYELCWAAGKIVTVKDDGMK